MYIPKNFDPDPLDVKEVNTSLNGNARIARINAVGGTLTVHTLLFNPIGSGVNLSLNQIRISSDSLPGGLVTIGQTTDTTGYNISTSAIRNMINFDNAVGIASEVYAAELANYNGVPYFRLKTEAPTNNDVIEIGAEQSVASLKLDKPVILTEGNGFWVQNSEVIKRLVTTFEYEEFPIVV